MSMSLVSAEVLFLALGWLVYGVLHSLLASQALKNWVERVWPGFSPWYRLAFNVIALLTALPLAWLHLHSHGDMLWRWQGAAGWLANGLAFLALLGLWHSAKAYDMPDFLGLKGAGQQGKPAVFTLSVWHRFVRHPWYFLSLVMVWTRDMDPAMLTSALAITLYFLLGSRLEEKKLVAEFGESYRRYQARVPGLWPLPWKYLSREEAAQWGQG